MGLNSWGHWGFLLPIIFQPVSFLKNADTTRPIACVWVRYANGYIRVFPLKRMGNFWLQQSSKVHKKPSKSVHPPHHRHTNNHGQRYYHSCLILEVAKNLWLVALEVMLKVSKFSNYIFRTRINASEYSISRKNKQIFTDPFARIILDFNSRLSVTVQRSNQNATALKPSTTSSSVKKAKKWNTSRSRI